MKRKLYSLVVAFIFTLLSINVTAQQPSITLLYPNAPGIEWAVGGTYVISWTATNVQGTFDIYLSWDGGANYSLIAQDVNGSTYYVNTTNWGYSNKCRIKITSRANPSIKDVGHKFKTVEAVGAFINIEQPAGGEVWAEGTTHLISWTDNLTAPVFVILKHGATEIQLATVSGSTYAWTIPTGYAGNNYRIKIMSSVTNSPTPPAISGKFKIKASAGTYIEVLQPNGGESWAKNTTHLISWIDDLPEPVNIEIKKGGTTVDVINNVVGSTYWWTIPNSLADGNNYRVYIRSSVDNSLYDKSDGKFSITSSAGTYIEVLQPNGGESWTKGSTYLISWIDDVPEPVNIELYKGSTKVEDIETNVTGSTYWWTVENTLADGNNYRVYVRSTVDNSLYDRSDAKFSIKSSSGSYIEVLQPNGGESWARGKTYLISWIDDLSEPVNIELYKGNTKVKDIATDVVGSTYWWSIDPGLDVSNKYRIYIRSADDNSLYDRSDAKFSVTESTGTYVEIYQPNGGESWARGTTHLISWIDDFPETVNIELWKGGSKVTDIATDVVGSTYWWDIPTSLAPGNNYKVKVYSTLDDDLKDFSDAKFSITASAGTYVNVIQPNGGEVWTIGNSYWVSWEDDIPEPVNIELWRGGSIEKIIQTDVVGSTYVWTIPDDVTPASNYKVKIYSTLDNSIKDFSDAKFKILASTMMSVYPNPAGERVTVDMSRMDNTGKFTIRVYDQFNKLLREYKTSSDVYTLPVSNLRDGIYFISVTNDKTRVTRKVIVVH